MDEVPASDDEPSVLDAAPRRAARPTTLDPTDPVALVQLVLEERDRRRVQGKKIRRIQEGFEQLRDLVLALAQQADAHETKVDQKMGLLRAAVDGVKAEFPGTNMRVKGLESAVDSLFELQDINQPVIDNLKARLQQLMTHDELDADFDSDFDDESLA